MQKLKRNDVERVRLAILAKQGFQCALTKLPLDAADAVLDHCHKSGQVRGVLHRGVNSMLGKIENHLRMAQLGDTTKLARFLAGVIPYLHAGHTYHPYIYPTHKTSDEKRVARNTKARKARAAKKEANAEA